MIERFGKWIDTRVEEWPSRLMTLAMIDMIMRIVTFTGLTVVGIFKIIQWATH